MNEVNEIISKLRELGVNVIYNRPKEKEQSITSSEVAKKDLKY